MSPRAAAITAALLALTLCAYLPVFGNQFVEFDDQAEITENLRLRAGFTWENLGWAFTSTEGANWYPLTRLSHLAGVRLFGLDPTGHHAVNLVLHLANTALLFLLLRAMTGTLWRSALVAALFGLHPLHVESVAWAAERKDVLCGFLWLLAVAAHRRYAARPGAGRYALCGALVAASLMAKPLAVTLPFALLLLDFWPLGRLGPRGSSSWRLLLEKAPFLALAAAGAALTFSAQKHSLAVVSLDFLSPAARLGTALLAYPKYLAKTLWPSDLSVLYFFHTQRVVAWQVVLAAVGLAAATALALRLARRGPWFAVGWLWFLGVLVPMIGIVQVGNQSFADRYTYLPHVGLFLAFAWSLGALSDRLRGAAPFAAGACGILVAACVPLTYAQAGRWRTTATLFAQALEVAPDNLYAEMALARLTSMEGNFPEGNRRLLAIVARYPRQPDVRRFLGMNYYRQGNMREALAQFEEEARVNPRGTVAPLYAAMILEREGRLDEAKRRYQDLLRLDPGNAAGRRGLERLGEQR